MIPRILAAICVAILVLSPLNALAIEQGDGFMTRFFCATKEPLVEFEQAIIAAPDAANELAGKMIGSENCFMLPTPWPFLVVERITVYRDADGITSLVKVVPYRMDTKAYGTDIFYALVAEPKQQS